MKNLYVITGSSRGIGEAIAKNLAGENNHVIGIARTRNTNLEKLYSQKGSRFDFLEVDLSDVNNLETEIESLFKDKFSQNYNSVTLVNNAGLLEPIDQIINTKAKDVIKHMNVNLTGLMILTASFLRHFQDQNIPKEVVSISSGAAYNPYTGWGSYCSSKAGSLMFSKVLAEEQSMQKHPAKVVSLAPGVVETEMQRTIRSKNENQFPNIDKFIELKEKGILYTTDHVGQTIVQEILGNKDIKNGAEIDLRDYQGG